MILLVLMIGVPIAEIVVFIEAGNTIGLWPTIGVIILTAMIGTFFLRYQGLGVLSRVMVALNKNEMPLKEMFEGLCLLIAAVLLLTPGFITDAVGFSLLIPPFRQGLSAVIMQRLIKSGRVHTHSSHARRSNMHGDGDGSIIDGEYDEIDPEIDPEIDKLPPHKP